jgi:predicted  nucleic acid-binding Zn-ribbon protein
VTAEKTNNLELSTKNEQLEAVVAAEKSKNKENAELAQVSVDKAERDFTVVKEENVQLRMELESLEKEVKTGLQALNQFKKKIRAFSNEF